MTNESEQKTEILGSPDALKKGIGTKDTALKAGPVVCNNVKNVRVKKKDGSYLENEKVVLICKHPDREDFIEISQVKYDKGNMLKVSGLWLQYDSDGMISKNSALASTMNNYKAETLQDFIGKVINTITDENGYLIIRAY